MSTAASAPDQQFLAYDNENGGTETNETSSFISSGLLLDPLVQPRLTLNPVKIISGTLGAVGGTVTNVGTGLVNLVTGKKRVVTTTPFPYPMVAKFFTDPGSIATGSLKNVTADPLIVKCLSSVINNYAAMFIRMHNFLPSCINAQKLSFVWMAPHALGLLPILKLMKVPGNVIRNCKYKGGCRLKVKEKEKRKRRSES